MALIHGITVELLVKTASGSDPFGIDTITESWESVDNVVVAPASSAEMTDAINLYGKRATYTLCIPKSDTHDWENTHVQFFGEEWRTIGKPYRYIDDMVPMDWNLKVMVESNGTAL